MTNLATLEFEQRDDLSLIRVRGEIDLSNAEEVSAAIEKALAMDRQELVVDLGETAYLDSAGVALFFRLAQRLRARRQRMRLVVPAEAPVRAVLELTGLSRLVPLEEDDA